MTIEYMPIFIDYTLHLDDSLNCQKKRRKEKETFLEILLVSMFLKHAESRDQWS
jgi:hypothetical protein